MEANKLRLQSFRTNDLVKDGGKQFELGKSWCDDFFEFDKTLPEVVVNLKFKALQACHVSLNDKIIELKLADVSTRGDRKAYANGNNGMSQIKDFFINDLQLTPEVNLKDYFAIFKTSEFDYYLYYVPSILYNNFLQFFKSVLPSVSINHDEEIFRTDNTTSLQRIFYGAPGTGKSHEIKKKTAGEAVIRTTFHPDSDYSTFVGAYKPVMDDFDIQVVPLVVNNGISLEQNKGTYKERRISYKFVMQAFLKAYLGAWKKYVDCNANFGLVANNSKVSLSFVIPNIGKYTVISVDSNGLKLSKEFSISKNKVLNVWGSLWKNDVFEIPKGPQSGASLEHAIGKWIYDKIDNCTSSSFDAGWEKLVEQIREYGSVEVQKQQIYKLTLHESEETLNVKVNETGKNRNTLKQIFGNPSNANYQLDSALVEMLNQFGNSFDEAWEKLKSAVNERDGLEKTKENKAYIKPQFLIIEEINRGNCAQIFGDLFQLLDRSSNGFSEYPIEADMDLQKEIERSFRESKTFKLENDINIEGAVEGYTSNYDATLSEDVKNGRVLLLPPNLYIWATMNTSDQSLFPIDSAFKRRWDWVYMPINTRKEQWFIEADNKKYSWSAFLEEINSIINEKTSSEDKQLGFYFCKAKNNIIDAQTFVSKVVFFLWNDVFKDYGFDGEYFADPDGGTLEFRKFFNLDGSINEKKVSAFMRNIKIDDEGGDNVDDEIQSGGIMKVSFPDNTIIEGATTVDVFMKTITKVVSEHGLEIVKNADIKFRGLNIIQDEGWQSDKYVKSAQKEMDGYVLFLNADNKEKKNALEKLSEKLNLGLNVEFVS